MVSPTDHEDMDIGTAKLNEAAFIQLLSAQVTVAALMMGSDFVFSALKSVFNDRPAFEKLIAAAREATKWSGCYEGEKPDG